MSKRKAFVCWRGAVQAIDVFDTAADASKARGGQECWLIVSRCVPNKPYRDEIFRGVKRDRGPDRRTEYLYLNELGEEQHCSYAKAFPSFAKAKRFLVKCARTDLKAAREMFRRKGAELARVSALKAPVPRG